jgi:hypothetical protein
LYKKKTTNEHVCIEAELTKDNSMKAIRYFHLRHPTPFSSEQFEIFRQNCVTWQWLVNEELENWPFHPVRAKYSVPVYKFGLAELSDDGLIATLPIGGDSSYIGVKAFEDRFPIELWQWFSLKFTRDLEVGYTFPGTFDDPRWRHLSDEEINKYRVQESDFVSGKVFEDPLNAIDGLTEEELLWTHSPDSLCILWHVGHIAYCEQMYVQHFIQGLEMTLPRFAVFKDRASAEEICRSVDSASSVLTWSFEVRRSTYEYIRTLGMSDFHQITSTSRDLSVAHWLFITAQHTAMHIHHYIGSLRALVEYKRGR